MKNEKILMKGNEAIAEAAVRGGCRSFFGYPITPQNEIPEYMSARMPEVGGVFIQAESEVSAINMVYGAGGSGSLSMTSSSSPGISLKQEGISYMAGAEIPAFIVNMVRSGPGLGGIQPAQCDYFQACKGGGHGDYKLLVYAPSTVQEAVDIAYDVFDKAFLYRMPVMMLGDGMLGQIMEAVALPEFKNEKRFEGVSWATDGKQKADKRRIINSLYIQPDTLEAVVNKLFAKYEVLAKKECRHEEYMCEDANVIITAYGTVARIAKSAIKILRDNGIKVGLIRPITLFPFPTSAYEKFAAKKEVKYFLDVELSMGQMIEDVRLSVNGKKKVEFFGRTGGNVMTAEDIAEQIIKREGKLNG